MIEAHALKQGYKIAHAFICQIPLYFSNLLNTHNLLQKTPYKGMPKPIILLPRPKSRTGQGSPYEPAYKNTTTAFNFVNHIHTIPRSAHVDRIWEHPR